MEHEDRALGSDLVEMRAGQSFLVAEVDRIEATDDERFGCAGAVVAHLLVELREPLDQRAVGRDAASDATEAMPIEPADVGQERERTLEAVRVGLDHPRDENEVGEAIVDLVRSPRGALLAESRRRASVRREPRPPRRRAATDPS